MAYQERVGAESRRGGLVASQTRHSVTRNQKEVPPLSPCTIPVPIPFSECISNYLSGLDVDANQTSM